MSEKLSDEIFRDILQSTPLIAIDLCVITAAQEILLGYRNNRPAQDFWFVPGGRIRKGETLIRAFSRITEQELGSAIPFEQGKFLGVYEHFYNDNFFDDSFGTHYVVLAYALEIGRLDVAKLPVEQHNDYRTVTLEEFERDERIHENSRAYFSALKAL